MAVIIPPTPISDFPGPLPNVVDSAFRQQALQWVNHLTTVKIGEFNALQTNVNNNATVAYEQAQAAQSSAADAAASAVDAESSAASAASANGYATAAAASATTASNAATAADASKTAAAGSATTATTKAGEAAASATTASGAATTATTKAGEASNSATTASAAATTATTKAGEASASATTASNAATAATTKASEASNSATTATTKAGEASASASAAEQAKLDAQAAAQSAAGGGEPTIIAGTTAQYWRGDKSWQTLDKSAVGLGNVDNVSAANLRDRATHTGTQAISTVSGLQTALDSKAAVGSDAGANLGVASAGSATTASRSDHVHKLPTAAEVGAAPSAHVGSGGTAHANATTSVDGFMSSADKTKLNDIASNATANASNAELRDRSTHTGTQAQSTVTNLTTDLAARVNRQDSYATVTSGVINLGLETELYHITVSGNVTVSVSNAPTTARVVKRLIVQYSSGVVTWPASFKLPTPMPTFAAGKAYVFSIEQSPNSGVYFLVPGPEYTYP